MHEFLLRDINFTEFPSKFTRYIKGMPIQTFEAILQNISTRIHLYAFTFDGHYNTRAISTLSNESFFSDLCHLDKESPQYPKACNVGKVMGHVVALNYFKHKPDKNFSLTTTMKGTYPVHLLEEQNDTFDNETESCHSAFYQNSKFDCLDLHKSKCRTQKYDISYTVNPQRCVPGVCKHYK